MRKLILKTESLDEFTSIQRKSYGVFLYAETISDSHELLFWNNQIVLPSDSDFTTRQGEYFQHLNNGYYVVLKSRINISGMSNTVVAYILIPVLEQYYLETDYLETKFVYSAEATKKITLSEQPTRYAIR